MADCWVRLGFALVAIALITAVFYQASNRSSAAFEPPALASSR